MEMLDKVIREQKVVRAQTEGGRMDPEALKKSQGKVTQATQAVAKAMGKNDKAEDGKGESKSKSEGKEKGDTKTLPVPDQRTVCAPARSSGRWSPPRLLAVVSA